MNNGTSLWRKISILLWGTAAGTAVGAGMMAVFAVAMWLSGHIPEQMLTIMVWIAVLGAAFTAGLISGIRSGHHGLWYGLCSSAVLGGILAVCSAAYGPAAVSAGTAVRLGGILLCGIAGGVLGVNRRLRY
ncbi:MAG: TIGR04086 family membrane protein [Clostridia bacterium]|nr:TIGR04086 family membrane protein [Clostridia bacterium]